MFDNGLKTYYLEIYKEFKGAETQAKKIVESTLPFNREIKSLIRKIKQTRKQLHKIFSHPVLYQICSKCHKEPYGGCCQLFTDCPHMYWRDLLYIIAENPKLELPHPDIRFLTSLEKPGCLFLGPEGCLFLEKRPHLCLTSVCRIHEGGKLPLGIQRLTNDGILLEGEIGNLSANLNKKIQQLSIHIQSKNKLHVFDNEIVDWGLFPATHHLK